MAEYIDKSDTETVFREIRKRLSAKKKDYEAIEYLIKDQMLSVAEEIIHAIPAADVVERKHGKWKTAYLDHEAFGIRPQVWYCSECQQITSFRTFFCPNCGADMREEPADV